MRGFVVLGVVAALASEAGADDSYKYDLKRIKDTLKTTPPARGVDKAPLGPPAWCGPLTEKPYAGGFEITLSDYYSNPETKGYQLAGAAERLCKNDPKEPIIHKAAQEVLQLWMNSYGLNAKDAVESLKLTLDKEANEGQKKKLCDALTISDEVEGPEKAFMQARRLLFDCSGNFGDIEMTGFAPMLPLVWWLDASGTPPDELVRLAYVSREARAIAKSYPDHRDTAVVAYTVAQHDMRLLSPDKALALLETEPYKGNLYARVTVKETLGLTRLWMLVVEDEVKRRADKDAEWKELLVTAPRRGADAWLAAAEKHKAELQRSNDFEQKAYGPSRKAMKGCLPVLKKDLAGVLKPLKHDTPSALIDAMNAHPVAGLLFRRFAACVAADGDASAAGEMNGLKGIRVIRGPRQAASFAAIEALGQIRADRPKFPISEHQIPGERAEILQNLTSELARGNKTAVSGDYSVWTGKGVVKTAKKDKDGLKVVFAKDKQKVWSESCTTTNRIIMFERDGTPIYYRKCNGKVVTADVSPDPITVPLELAEGVAPGRMISFGVSNSQERRVSMPFEVYGDKQGKKLVAWYTIPL